MTARHEALLRLSDAVEALSEREANLMAELVGGMAFAQDEVGLVRPGAVWRALGCLLLDHAEAQAAVVEALERSLDEEAPDGDSPG